jgi:hypothetical protein
MAVSRDGTQVTYISRQAWLARGSGQPRANHTGVYEGAFDAATAVAVRGFLQVADETWVYGFGSQYTHGGYVDMTHPTCRGSPKPCPVKSGIQKLVLRRHGFVSLSTAAVGDGAANSGGNFTTEPFVLPVCAEGQSLSLHLNIFAAIGRGAYVELHFAK